MMKKSHSTLLVLPLLIFTSNFHADEPLKDDGFVPLFNGVDLKGWVGNTDGYKAVEGVLICQLKKSKGAKIYTAKEYADFIFQFEFKLTPGANNGVGIRAPLTGKLSKIQKNDLGKKN